MEEKDKPNISKRWINAVLILNIVLSCIALAYQSSGKVESILIIPILLITGITLLTLVAINAEENKDG